MTDIVLSVHDVHTYYGSIHALQGISLEVARGEIVTLIGGNGAGKSTTLNSICGIVHARSGEILLNGADLVGTPAHQITARGVVQVPEGRRIFARLTVQENLEMGAFIVRDKASVRARVEQAFLIDLPQHRQSLESPNLKKARGRGIFRRWLNEAQGAARQARERGPGHLVRS